MSETSPTSPTREGRAPGIHHVDLQLRWSDMDAYGHVNNVEFLRLLESARVLALADWFDSDPSTSGAETIMARGLILAHQEIEYLEQLHYRPAPLRVHLWVTKIGGASFTLGYEMRDPDPDEQAGTLYARAESVLAMYDMAAGRIRTLTADQRGVLEGLRGPAVPFRRRR